MTADMIRIVLADDHQLVRAGLKSIVASARDMIVVGEASNGRELVDLVASLEPDVVVTDLSMPELDGLAATKEILASRPDTRVVILTMHEEEDYLTTVMEAGAAGYLVKTDADRDLVNSIRAVAHGDVYVRPSAMRVLMRKKASVPTEREQFEHLTRREQEVLTLVGQGYSAPEIGERLQISAKTVDTYKQRIGEKVGLTHRPQYVQFALNLGLLTDTTREAMKQG